MLQAHFPLRELAGSRSSTHLIQPAAAGILTLHRKVVIGAHSLICPASMRPVFCLLHHTARRIKAKLRRILLVSYHFPPSNAVGAKRAGRLARLLPDFGYSVDVVCASLDRAVGSLDASQSRLVPDEKSVVRVETPFILGRHPYDPPSPGSVHRRLWWKARAYLEWVFLTEDWSSKWGQAALDTVRSRIAAARYHMLVVDAPPNPSIVPFVRLANRVGLPTVIDLRDLWFPECSTGRLSGEYSVLPNIRRSRWNARLRDEMVRLADRIVLTSEEMAEALRRDFPDLAPSRFHFVPNAFQDVDLKLPRSGGHLIS